MKSSIVAKAESPSQKRVWAVGKPEGRTVLVSHQHLAVEDLVVAENIVEDLLIQDLGWCLEGDLHAAGLFDLEIDVSVIFGSVCRSSVTSRSRLLTGVPCSIECPRHPIQPPAVHAAQHAS